MESDTELAGYFKTWTPEGDVVETSSATADLFERVWSQVQAFQEGTIAAITATAVTQIDFIGRTHCLDVNQTEMMELIADRLQNTRTIS